MKDYEGKCCLPTGGTASDTHLTRDFLEELTKTLRCLITEEFPPPVTNDKLHVTQFANKLSIKWREIHSNTEVPLHATAERSMRSTAEQ